MSVGGFFVKNQLQQKPAKRKNRPQKKYLLELKHNE
jgi:hypothetical protein